jgi:hypothetical protein
MLHEKISVDRLDSLDIAAVWPSSAQIAPVPIPDLEPKKATRAIAPTPDAPDVPSGVGGMILPA